MPRQTRRGPTLGQGAFRHLAGAENHRIHLDKRLLAVFNNPQAVLVNPLVADPGMEAHIVAFHLGAVDPTRGLAQVRPRLRWAAATQRTVHRPRVPGITPTPPASGLAAIQSIKASRSVSVQMPLTLAIGAFATWFQTTASLQPNALVTLLMVSKRGLAPSANDL